MPSYSQKGEGLNFDKAVQYHYDAFPPPKAKIDYSLLIKPLTKAAEAIARYDQMLKGMHNSEILLAPLRSQEAVISSRMEGTVSTIDEIMRYAASQSWGREENTRTEAIEVFLYSRALKNAQRVLEAGSCSYTWLIQTIHRELLMLGRGSTKSPGEFKSEQNYIIDEMTKEVLFVPINPLKLNDGLGLLFNYLNDSDEQDLIKLAISHVEFEALHPFKDGNGRIGRMLITLDLWQKGIIAAPHFYVSSYFEQEKKRYITCMRNVSKENDWTGWCVFFMEALAYQAINNLQKAEDIQKLYEEMKGIFRDKLASSWCIQALDFMFKNPIFYTTKFRQESGIPGSTASRFIRVLTADTNLLKILEESSGQRPALLSFEPLLELVRG